MHNFFRPGKNGNSAGSEVTTGQWRQRLIDADCFSSRDNIIGRSFDMQQTTSVLQKKNFGR